MQNPKRKSKPIKKPFTHAELLALRGNYTKVARKLCVSQEYVRHIASGRRDTQSKKSKTILADLKILLTVLPIIE